VSRLVLELRVPSEYKKTDIAEIIRAICTQVNNLSEGRLSARYNAQSSVPTTNSYAKGDFIPDINCTSSASVAAGLGAAYVRLGWVCTSSGSPGTFVEARALTGGGTGFPSFSPITSSLGADVALNNTANYFDGPSIAQGTSGTWFVTGTVTVDDTSGAAVIDAKLWDGNTVIASCRDFVQSANRATVINLSGYIASPAGNLRISVKDSTNTSGKIVFNASGNSKDSTITAIRIA
jgi:hypothetical protein